MAATTKITHKRKLVIAALEKFPNSSKHSIAKYLFEKHPLHWNSLDSARYNVRELTGATGIRNAEINIKRKVEYTPSNQYGLGESKAKKRQFVNIPTNYNNIIWMSDIHFPNHDIEAITAALDYAKKVKINCIVLGGDILDNEPFTNHDAPPPSATDVVDWFTMVENFLDMLKKHFPQAKIYWLEGNHDAWYKRYLMKKAPVLFNDEYFRLPQRLGLKKRGIEFLDDNIILKAGALHLSHGHTLVRGFLAPVNPARGLFLKTKSNYIMGHVHQNSYHPERNVKGEIIGCWSVGCLCTLAPDYDHHNTKHGQGFAHITVGERGAFKVDLKEIYNGRIL